MVGFHCHDLELAIRMRASYKVGQVYYPTQQITELIEVFDHMLEVVDRLRCCHLLHHGIAALYRHSDKVNETLGMGKVFVAYYSCGCALLGCALEAVPERSIIENLAEGVVICLAAGRQAVERVGGRIAWFGGGGGHSGVEASLAAGVLETLVADPWRLLCACEALKHIGLRG